MMAGLLDIQDSAEGLTQECKIAEEVENLVPNGFILRTELRNVAARRVQNDRTVAHIAAAETAQAGQFAVRELRVEIVQCLFQECPRKSDLRFECKRRRCVGHSLRADNRVRKGNATRNSKCSIARGGEAIYRVRVDVLDLLHGAVCAIGSRRNQCRPLFEDLQPFEGRAVQNRNLGLSAQFDAAVEHPISIQSCEQMFDGFDVPYAAADASGIVPRLVKSFGPARGDLPLELERDAGSVRSRIKFDGGRKSAMKSDPLNARRRNELPSEFHDASLQTRKPHRFERIPGSK